MSERDILERLDATLAALFMANQRAENAEAVLRRVHTLVMQFYCRGTVSIENGEIIAAIQDLIRAALPKDKKSER